MKTILFVLLVLLYTFNINAQSLVIKFDYNSDVLKDEYKNELNALFNPVLKMGVINEVFNIELVCSTCHIGDPNYNYDLAERRAKAVIKYIRTVLMNDAEFRIEVINNGQGLNLSDRKCELHIYTKTEKKIITLTI